MASKPKYFYNLSIYDPVVDQSHPEKNAAPRDPPGWYFPIGVGNHMLSWLESTKTSGKKLTMKGSELLDYASSLEGTVKIGFIGSCTCAGGVMSLLVRPKGIIRKLFYPSLFMATSSAICYPSKAYIVAKTGLVYAYNGSESVYNLSKHGIEKISKWRSVRKLDQEQAVLEQQLGLENMNEKMTPGQESQVDMAPLKNPPILFNEAVVAPTTNIQSEVGADMDSVETSTPISSNPSIVDLGQSSPEDKDLYTTRL